jgi:hypothetical protein
VLEQAQRHGVRKRRIPLAAVDGTGLESRHTSRYYVKRRASTGDRDQITTYSKFPKVVFVVDCTSHMILAAVPGRGPCSDLVQFRSALEQSIRRARIGTLLADADFDAEWVHCGVRDHGIRTIIPATRGRPTDKPPTGRWRRRMKQGFARYKRKYGQRWQVETVNSMIKRLLGSALRARLYHSQCRETILRAITHNVMIVRTRVFYRAGEMAGGFRCARTGAKTRVVTGLTARELKGSEEQRALGSGVGLRRPALRVTPRPLGVRGRKCPGRQARSRCALPPQGGWSAGGEQCAAS